jgi:tight adherence protein C
MPVYVYVGAAMVAGAAIALVVSLHGIRVPGRLVRTNLAAGGDHTTDLREMVLARPTRERVVHPVGAWFARLGRRFTPRGVAARLEQRISVAGLGATWPIERVLAAKFVLAGVGAFVGLVVFLTSPSATGLLLGGLLAGCGYYIPDALLARRADDRQERIERELADVMDQVTICVEAGLGFEAALQRAATTGDGPLAGELARTLQDIGLGMPRRVALDHLHERTEVPDLRHFVVAIAQAERHGVPIAHVLRVQADELREKRRQRAEEHAAKIPVKLMIPLVLCIMPSLFVVILGPAAIRISHLNFGG